MKNEKWIIEYLDTKTGKWFVEGTFDNEEDCSLYYRLCRSDYPDVTFRARKEE